MFDLHFHSTWSDGHFTPEQILDIAQESRLTAISLTDHDEIRGFQLLRELAAGTSIRVLPGVEISTTVDEHWAHILSYGFNPEDSDLIELLRRNREAKQKQARAILSRLRGFGIHVEFESLLSGRATDCYVGRGMIADVLVPSVFERSSTVFRRFLGRRGSCYVSAATVTAEEAIEVVHAAGGVAVLAHPSRHDIEYTLPRLVPAGLDGVERFRPRVPRRLEELIQTAAVYDKLFVTGGSDWHGREGDRQFGEFAMEASQVEEFLQRVEFLA